MGFDWEEILGDTDYEDAVDMAAEALEKMQDEESEEEAEGAEATTSEADAEGEDASAEVSEVQTKPVSTGAGFMDGMSDEPVFN